MSSILIKNGLVYDGEGNPAVKKNILVQKQKIVRLGSFSKRRVDQVIDATGAIITPGFIDINTDADHYLTLFSEPNQEDLIKQGITTIIGGNCGSSLAPLIDGSLVSVRKWGDLSQININWHSVSEFLTMLARRGLGVNFGTLIGHSTIRRALIGDTARDLSFSELEVFQKIITQSFEEGAFGFSTGLGYLHARYVPLHEIIELAKTTAQHHRVYATHLRNVTNKLQESVKETIEIAQKTGVNLEISHFQPLKDFTDDYQKAKDLIQKESTQSRINFDCYPFETTTKPIYTFLPEWIQEKKLEVMLDHINNQHFEERLIKYFSKLSLSQIIIGHTHASLNFLTGKSLKEFAANNNLSLAKSFLKLMRVTRLKVICLYKEVDLRLLEKFMVSPNAIIASNGFKQTFFQFLQWTTEHDAKQLQK